MDNPEGKYTNVSVTPITPVSGHLTGGTGTLSSFGMFSCGDFKEESLPEIDGFYNIVGMQGEKLFQFNRWSCVHSGKTSDFKFKGKTG